MKTMRNAVVPVACAAAMLALYSHVLVKLVHDWATDDNYSHGFLIIPIALFLVWERRAALSSSPVRPNIAGLAVVLGSLAVLVAGVLGVELFLTRISLVGVLAGSVLFLYGWRYLRLLAFPLAFLLLMIPVPAILFNQVAFPLQLMASSVGAAALSALHIPVLREGNVMILATTSLEVAEACSGIRSLVSLLTLGIIYGYFTEPRNGVRVLLAVATVPIAIAANAFRVAGTGVAASFYGAGAAEGFLHTFSGWLVFVSALAMLFGLHRLVLRLAPARPLTRSPRPQPAPRPAPDAAV